MTTLINAPISFFDWTSAFKTAIQSSLRRITTIFASSLSTWPIFEVLASLRPQQSVETLADSSVMVLIFEVGVLSETEEVSVGAETTGFKAKIEIWNQGKQI